MDRLITIEPSNLVPIRIEPSQKCTGNFTLRNVMYTMPVAFRLNPSIKSLYTFKPHSAIIPPLSSLQIQITYHSPSNLPQSLPHSNHSFTLHSVIVPNAAIKDPSSSFDSVPSHYFTTKNKHLFIDTSLKLIFLGSTVLTHLVQTGAMDDVREVLEKSDPTWNSVDSVNENGETLLHLAIAQSRPDLVQLILEFGPDLEKVSGFGATPLEAAAGAGEALIVELLLARGARTGRVGSGYGAVHVAAGRGYGEVVRLLIVKGVDVNEVSGDGNMALHLAVEGRRRDCVRLLLANGASVDVRNKEEGDTPLHIAARIGDEQMVNLLLNNGANKHIRNQANHTPFHAAANSGHTRLYDSLRLADDLCAAARLGDVTAIQRLIEAGACVNGRDQNGWTALHRAAFKGRVGAARALIELGAEIDAEDEAGYTALHCAAEAGQAAVVELLVERGAAVETTTNKGVTAMEIAQWMQYAPIMRILIHGGAEKDEGRLKKKEIIRSGGRVRRICSAEFDKSVLLSVV